MTGQNHSDSSPYSIITEERLIGCMITYPEVIDEVTEIIQAEHIYLEELRLIYSSILSAYATSKVELISIVKELRARNALDRIGGVSYLSRLSSEVLPSNRSNVQIYALEIHNLWTKRELINRAQELIRKAYDSSVPSSEALFYAEASVAEIMNGTPTTHKTDFLSGIQEAEYAIKKREELSLSGKLSGINTGFDDINRMTGGFQRGNLVILAARPSMGKTAIALEFAKAAAKTEHGCLFISLEMSRLRIVDRIIQGETDISRGNYMSGQLTEKDKEELAEWKHSAKNWNLEISDTKHTMESIKFAYKRAKKVKPINLIVIDYLQLVSMDGMASGLRKDEKISLITKYLKRLANEEDIPIILLSQLNRASETRGGDKRPMLSDLKESGSIEEDADLVMLLYRPEYYGMVEDAAGNNLKGVGEIIIAKHRDGPVGTIRYRHDGKMSKFYAYNKQVDDDINVSNLPF